MPPSAKGHNPQFSAHAEPRVWFITSASSPVGLAVAQEVLRHGDLVIAGDDTKLATIDKDPRPESLVSPIDHVESQAWEERLKVVRIDTRYEALSVCRWCIIMSLLLRTYDQERGTMSGGYCESHDHLWED